MIARWSEVKRWSPRILGAALVLGGGIGEIEAQSAPAVEKATREVLAKHDGKIRAGLWVGGATGPARFASEPDAVMPTASAIKTAILVELFARYADALDRPAPGLDAILKDDHPAIAHFPPKQRDEIRQGLAGATVRRIGGVMMGAIPATNLVYNAAANASIALLGGPEATTRAIAARDAAFEPIRVRRYMLTNRKTYGDNEATTAALAAVFQRIASRSLVGVAPATIDAIRGSIIVKADPHRGRTYLKDGELENVPITSVRSGWRETPDGKLIVFVAMLARDDAGDKTPDEAHKALSATANKVAEALLDSEP
ncbi:hypothetical protein TA3x_001656 [Tundrisphaera sp. TA3]|uniref:hypothetical protein n=1 Tax=Tundrisphaera sp. TA3 TaxID=3435775 RepID=UPI003EB81464